MTPPERGTKPRLRRLAYQHPVLTGLAVFAVLYVPLALLGTAKRDWSLVLLPLPGAVLFGVLWLALYGWGRQSSPAASGAHRPGGTSGVPSNVDRNLAQIAQLGVIVVPALVPAVVLYSFRDRPFVRTYAAQALNLQLVLAVAMATLSITFIASDFGQSSILVLYPVVLAVYVFTLSVSLMGTIKAANGITWRYPLSVPIFR